MRKIEHVDELRRGMVCRHHSGRVYTIVEITNHGARTDDFPLSVSYLGANGQSWSRKASEFVEKFTVLFDGTNLA